MKAVSSLHADALDSVPRNYDWSSSYPDIDVGLNDDGNGWRFWDYAECYECGRLVDHIGTGHKEDCSRDGEVPDSIEGPMMSYWYPIDDDRFDPEEAALVLAKAVLPLCVVQVDGDYGLALTGGGMDLSWEIVEAFVRLGYLPPVHFCRLPAMAGKRLTHNNKVFVSACRRSLRVAKQRIDWKRADLENLVGTLKLYELERKGLTAPSFTSEGS